MRKKINKKNTDPTFDGHLEKPLNKMTPKEKLQFLWKQINFKHSIKNKVIIKKNN
jgi:hypothetical protein